MSDVEPSTLDTILARAGGGWATIDEIITGNGNVRLNSNGLHISGPTKQYDINGSGGFIARRDPDDGTQLQMTVVDAPSNAGPFIGWTLPSPTVVNGTDLVFGSMFTEIGVSGAVDTPSMHFISPKVLGKDSTRIDMYGTASDDTERRMEIFTDNLMAEGRSLGLGLVDFVIDAGGSSGAIGNNVEDVALTTGGFNYRAGRAYRIEHEGRFSVSTGGTAPLFRFRKTNAAGALLGFPGRQPTSATAGAECHAGCQGTFVCTGSVNAQLCMTVNSGVLGTTVNSIGTFTYRALWVYDIGSASDYPATLPQLS